MAESDGQLQFQLTHPEPPPDAATRPGVGFRYAICGLPPVTQVEAATYYLMDWKTRSRSGTAPEKIRDAESPEHWASAWWTPDPALAWTGKTVGVVKGLITRWTDGRNGHHRFKGVTDIRVVPVVMLATDVRPAALLRAIAWLLEGYGIGQRDLSYLWVLHDHMGGS